MSVGAPADVLGSASSSVSLMAEPVGSGSLSTFDADVPIPACWSIECTVGSEVATGAAVFVAGASDPACWSIEGTVGSGDVVGPTAFVTGTGASLITPKVCTIVRPC